MSDDVHIMPVDDLREHTERRDCWCEPQLEWPCVLCFKCYVELPNGTKIGHDHGVQHGVADRHSACPWCKGTGTTTRPNHLRCMVIHDAKDGRE